MLAEGIDKLEPFAPACQGIDVSGLINDASALRAELIELGPDRMSRRDARRAVTVRLAAGHESIDPRATR